MTRDTIGALRHRVKIERPVRTSASAGTATLSWKHHALVFAHIEAVGGRELALSHGVAGRVTHKVLIRHRDDVLPEMRFVWAGRLLEIRAVLDTEGRQRRLQCMCEESSR